jgi:hypothetical protein
MAKKPIEAGDALVLHVPVVRVDENDPWSTVTFSLGAKQWVTIPQEAKEIVSVLNGASQTDDPRQPAIHAFGLDVKGRGNGPVNESNKELVREWTVQPTADGASTQIVLKSNSAAAGFALSPEDLTRFAFQMLVEAGRVAEQLPEAPPLHETNPVLLRPHHASFEPHPSDASATIAAFAIGKLRLALSLDTSMLFQAVKILLDHRRARPPSRNTDAGPSTSEA